MTAIELTILVGLLPKQIENFGMKYCYKYRYDAFYLVWKR